MSPTPVPLILMPPNLPTSLLPPNPPPLWLFCVDDNVFSPISVTGVNVGVFSACKLYLLCIALFFCVYYFYATICYFVYIRCVMYILMYNYYVYLSGHGFLSMCLIIFSSLINLRYTLIASSHLNVMELDIQNLYLAQTNK